VKLFDASALLAFLQEEEGYRIVERELAESARCSAVNWSEVAHKVLAHGGDWSLARSLLHSYGLRVEPVLEGDAERAAALWRRGSGLSLADRICLATAERLDAHVWTADAVWGSSATITQIR
jgi:ribonuclease VapC